MLVDPPAASSGCEHPAVPSPAVGLGKLLNTQQKCIQVRCSEGLSSWLRLQCGQVAAKIVTYASGQGMHLYIYSDSDVINS